MEHPLQPGGFMVLKSRSMEALLMRFGGVTGPQQSAPHRGTGSFDRHWQVLDKAAGRGPTVRANALA